MDLKKEIKLSDLLPGRKKTAAPDEPKAEKPKKEQRRQSDKAPAKSQASVGRKKKLVGLKIGASQIAAAQVVNNGGAQVTQVAREDLELREGFVFDGDHGDGVAELPRGAQHEERERAVTGDETDGRHARSLWLILRRRRLSLTAGAGSRPAWRRSG